MGGFSQMQFGAQNQFDLSTFEQPQSSSYQAQSTIHQTEQHEEGDHQYRSENYEIPDGLANHVSRVSNGSNVDTESRGAAASGEGLPYTQNEEGSGETARMNTST